MYIEQDRIGPSLRALNKLERSAWLCHQVFAQARDQVISDDLRALMARRSQEYRAGAALLHSHARRLGADGQPHTTAAPAWAASHSVRAEAIDALALEHCERAEDDLLEATGDVLTEKLEPASALVIEELRLQTRTQHLLLRAMRDRIRQLLWQPVCLSEVLAPEQQGFTILQQQLARATERQQHLGRHMAEG